MKRRIIILYRIMVSLFFLLISIVNCRCYGEICIELAFSIPNGGKASKNAPYRG